MVLLCEMCCYTFFFFKQRTAYEMRSSDWSSDVCSSDLLRAFADRLGTAAEQPRHLLGRLQMPFAIGAQQSARLLDRHPFADAGDDVVQRTLRGGGIERSEERRVGKGRGRTCRYRWSP